MEKILEKLEKLQKLSDPQSKRLRQPSTSQAAANGETPTKSGDHRHRMTEKEEDEELMMNDTNELDNEDEIITRFDASPWCKFFFVCLIYTLFVLILNL